MTRQTTMRGATALILALVLAGCESITRDEPPAVAREVDTEVPLELILSTDFVLVRDEATGNVDPGFRAVDTLMITADYDETLALDLSDPRLFVHLGNVEDPVAVVRLRVFLDGQSEYDASANLGNGGFLEYLFRYNQPSSGR